MLSQWWLPSSHACRVGAFVGEVDGDTVENVGDLDGSVVVGETDGETDGGTDGKTVGLEVGTVVGKVVGEMDGAEVVGEVLGDPDGSDVVGAVVGATVKIGSAYVIPTPCTNTARTRVHSSRW